MASSDRVLTHQRSNHGFDDPNHTPYNSFSSFKYIDNTVVSAYEVGIANGLSPKNKIPKTKSADKPVPRERKSLAGKPPSGARLDYKPVGTTSKPKSLTEINTTDSKGNKIPDNSVKRFDNGLGRHYKSTPEIFMPPAYVPDVNTIEDICDLTVNTGNCCENAVENDHVKDVRHAGAIVGTDCLFESVNCDIDRSNSDFELCTDLELCNQQNKIALSVSNENKCFGSTRGFNRRHSLENGVQLPSFSNLFHGDSNTVFRSRLESDGSEKRYPRRRQRSLQKPPTSELEIVAKDSELFGATGNETKIDHPVSSRRKLPKVPLRTSLPAPLISAREDLEKTIPLMATKADSIPCMKSTVSTSENVCDKLIDENKMSLDDTNQLTPASESARGNHTSSPNRTEAGQSQLKQTEIISEMIDGEIVSGEDTLLVSSQPLPSHCNPSKFQDIVPVTDIGEDAQNTVQDAKEIEKGENKQVRSNLGTEMNIEDKFRKKLKAIISSDNTKESKAANNNVRNVNETKHLSSNKHEEQEEVAIIRSASKVKTNIDYNASLVSQGAKENVNGDTKDIEYVKSDTKDIENVKSDTKDIEYVTGEAFTWVEATLPENSMFNFSHDVIQELTDLVMTRPESRCQSQTPDISETQDSTTSYLSDISTSTETEDRCIDSNHNKFVENQVIDRTIDDDLLKKSFKPVLNPCQKLDIEGQSFNGKIDNDRETVIENSALRKQDIRITDDLGGKVSVKVQKTIQSDPPHKRTQVSRTPSYRKRVMARAKMRYSKKSQNLKECSCSKNKNGDLEQCTFCQHFEIKKRSQTSLGYSSLADYSDSECSDIASPRRALTPEISGRSLSQGRNSPRSIRKVNVSPRVDVLLSSNLFKKHLQKHENLLQKHTMSYKRFGMNKAVSNLDLSEGFSADIDSSCMDTASETSEPESERQLVDDGLDVSSHSSDLSKLSDGSNSNRRHSLTGDTDIQFTDYALKTMLRKKSGDTLPSSFTKPRSRPGLASMFDNVRNKTPPRNLIPSFHEFRKQKEINVNTTNDNQRDNGSQFDVDNVKSHTADLHEKRPSNDIESEHNLQTVLETDERGSKENLLTTVSVNQQTLQTEAVPSSAADLSSQKQTSAEAQEMKSTSYQTTMLGNVVSKPHRSRKGKSRTLPNIDISAMSDNSSDQSSSMSVSGRSRISAKRPRSVISRKSSGDSDTTDTSEKDSQSKTNVSARPKLKGHGKKIIRSESDSKYETEKGKDLAELADLKSMGTHSRHLSLLEKGNNSVSFNLEVTQNDGASDVSSSMTESLQSDSLYSESCVNETITSIYDADIINGSSNDLSSSMKDDFAAPVLRSTSDACDTTQEVARKRRDRKERPYKSDPFSGTEIIPATNRCALREEKAKLRDHLSFASSSKEEILSFLDGVSEAHMEKSESLRSLEELSEDEQKSTNGSETSADNLRRLGKHPSNVSSLSTDSGVIGQEGSHDSKQNSPSNTLTHSKSDQRATWNNTQIPGKRSLSASCSDLLDVTKRGCHDCSFNLPQSQTIYICPNCKQQRIERKKIIQEVIDTEMNYGRDLKILQEEFNKPMLKAGLLTKDQLDSIFLNLDELIHVNVHFITKLKAAINHSNIHDDEDLREVMIGSLFLESSTMFLTFENYCVNQARAPILLEQLEKEKELLRIFLRVSQSDNHLLRRMHLKSFLMVPVQRIMKYPLLLDRLYKVTLDKHRDRKPLKEAKEKIEDILGHINAKSKTTSIKQRKGSEKHYSVTEKIEVSRVAIETLGWNRKDVCDVITTRLQITQPLDHMWAAKKCKHHKFTAVHGVLLSLVQQNIHGKDNDQVSSKSVLNDNNTTNNNNNNNTNNNNNLTNTINSGAQVQSAAVVLIKEKNGRYQVAREPFMLEKCVVSQDPDFMEVFELLEWNRESFLIKAENPTETKTWVQHLRRQMQNLGMWRKRRNALPNILLNYLS